MDKILPNLENYLRDKNLQTKLKNILKKKQKYENNLLRKYLFEWYSKMGRQNPENIYTNDETEDVANKIKDLKKSIYMKSIIIKYQKEDKNKVRKCFYKWYKKVIFMKIKEEITKTKQREDEFKDRENELMDEYNKKLLIYKSQMSSEDNKEI